MDFNELHKKIKEYNARADFEPALLLLRDAAQQILKGEKIPIPDEKIEKFLKTAYSTIDWGVDYQRGAVWTNRMGDIADEIMREGLQIIRKYSIQNLRIRIPFIRFMSAIESDPEIVKVLDKELDELTAKDAALMREGENL